MSTETASQKWICESCGLIYDPAEGDPDGGVPPGTQFADIPATRDPDSVTFLEEERIVSYFGAGTLYASPSRAEPLL